MGFGRGALTRRIDPHTLDPTLSFYSLYQNVAQIGVDFDVRNSEFLS